MSRRGLRLLILAVSDRCDQRCAHCDIWMGTSAAAPSLTLDERLRVVDDALAAGAREALLTGGEPLLSPDLWPIAARLRAAGARVMLATNGMQLERLARRVADAFDEVYVSLDGADAVTHDGVRGVPAFDRVAAGVRALRAASTGVRVVARSTLHARNLDGFEGIVAAARAAGFHQVSFLALDASSGAFGGRPEARRALLPSAAQVDAFEETLARRAAAGGFDDGFVAEPVAKLHRLARHLRASAGTLPFERPACDAPLWSSVVEVDGTVRPCFFQPAVGHVRAGLMAVRESEAQAAALARIQSANETCARCVCPKQRQIGWGGRVKGFLGMGAAS